LDVVGDKEKDEKLFKWETSHPTKDSSTHEQPLRVDFIESWFQSIVGQAMKSGFWAHLVEFYFSTLWEFS
jgi:hypothetical protein